MPPGPKSSRQAIRIPQSSRLKRLKSPCRTGRPYEYPKAPGSIASNPHVEPKGHTNTSNPHVGPKGHTNTLKPSAQTPPGPKSSRQATRIPQSSRLKRLKTPCRTGRPYEYPKAPGSFASNPHVEPAGKKSHMTPSIWEKPLSSRSFAHL